VTLNALDNAWIVADVASLVSIYPGPYAWSLPHSPEVFGYVACLAGRCDEQKQPFAGIWRDTLGSVLAAETVVQYSLTYMEGWGGLPTFSLNVYCPFEGPFCNL
jgi:hypothetical protein